MMPDVMSMFDPSKWLTHDDLKGKDWTLVIEKVQAGEVIGLDGKKAKKPVLTFVGAGKPLAICKTDARTITSLYGKETSEWVGKSITLFPSTTRLGMEANKPCVRVRPAVPK